MAELVLAAKERGETGKGAASRLRRAGFLPAVVYGKALGNLPVQVETKEVEKILARAGEKSLIRLRIQDGQAREYSTLIREIQRHPVKRDLVHIDFYQISLEEDLVTEVPVLLEGEPPGVKAGGVLQHSARTVEVECRPADLPAELILDISSLGLGEVARVADLPVPPGVRVRTDPDMVLASIVVPRGVTGEEAPPAEGGPAEEK